MSTTQTNPLFTRSEKGRFGRTMKKRAKHVARTGLSKIFGIPLSRGLGQASPSKTSSRHRAHRSAKPSSGTGPSTAVRSDVIEALRGQGYSAGVAKKMAEGVRADDTFESAFRRVISRNPAELIIFGNPSMVYSRKNVIKANRAGNPIPAALISAFESAAGSKLFDEVPALISAFESAAGSKLFDEVPAPKKKRNSHHGGTEARRKAGQFDITNGKSLIGPFPSRKAAREYLDRWKVNAPQTYKLHPRRIRKANPDAKDPATKLFEKFHHRSAGGVFERQRSARQRKDYTILGPLVAIGINPEYFDKMAARAGAKQWADWMVEHYDQLPRLDFMTPGQVDQVKSILGDPEQYIKDCPLLASSPNGRQLYALAEDVQIDLSKFETDAGKDYVDLGDATFVVYIAKKPHEVREWVHMMGEDGGTRPRLMYDRLRKEVCFIGGSYVVKAPGIMH
jgi:hypothetical protein